VSYVVLREQVACLIEATGVDSRLSLPQESGGSALTIWDD
jgi:hypothetical protein